MVLVSACSMVLVLQAKVPACSMVLVSASLGCASLLFRFLGALSLARIYAILFTLAHTFAFCVAVIESFKCVAVIEWLWVLTCCTY